MIRFGVEGSGGYEYRSQRDRFVRQTLSVVGLGWGWVREGLDYGKGWVGVRDGDRRMVGLELMLVFGVGVRVRVGVWGGGGVWR